MKKNNYTFKTPAGIRLFCCLLIVLGLSALQSNAQNLVPFSGSNAITTCSGTIQDHAGAGTYSNNANGFTSITSSTAGNQVRLSFTEFQTESGFDFVTIFDGIGTGGAILFGPTSGSPALPVVTSTTGSLTIRFTSDGSVTGNGFTATISCVPPAYLVPFSGTATVADCAGLVQDHGGPGAYSNGANGTLTINPGIAGNFVRLTFTEFSTESGFDFVTIFDGVGTGGTILFGPTSGSPALPVVTSVTGSLTIRFTSDASVTGNGFTASISCIAPPTFLVPFSGSNTVTACSGIVQDHAGAGPYSNNANGFLVINPSTVGNLVTLTFTQFATESGFDFVTIFDGVGTGGTILFGPTSGSPALPTVTSLTGSLTIRFTSDGSVTANGFSANISCSAPCTDFNLTAPFTHSSTTVGAGNDCSLRPSTDRTYRITIPTTGLWNFSLCTSSPTWDSYIYLTTACCGGTTLAFDDDGCGGVGLSTMSNVPLTAGSIVYCTVEGFSAGGAGAYNLVVTMTPPVCQDFALTAPFTHSSTTVGAGNDCTLRPANDRTYAITITTACNYSFSLCGGTTWDSYMYLTTACCGGTTLATDDDFCSFFGLSSINNIALTPGTYYLTIEGFSAADAGAYTLAVTCAVPPPNDLCTGAPNTPLAAGGSVTFTGTTSGAGPDGPLTLPTVFHKITTTTCVNLEISYCSTVPAQTTVYQIIGTTCPVSPTYPDPSYLLCDNFGGAQFTCTNGSADMFWANLPAGTYYIPVAGAPVGPYSIVVSATACVPPPANDLPCGAFPITCGTTVSGNTSSATNDLTAPDCGGFGSGRFKGLWHTFTINFASQVQLSLCGSSFDSYMELYSGSCGSLSCVTFDDDFCAFFGPSQITVPSLPAGQYWVLVSGFAAGNAGPYNLALQCSSLVPPNIISNSPVCEGRPINVSAPVTGTSYQWSFNGNPIPGATNHDYTVPSANPLTDAGTYSVLITTTSSFTVSGVVVVNPAPDVSVIPVPNFCQGTHDLDIDATVTSTIGGSSFTYLWTGPLGYTANTEDVHRSPSLSTQTGSYKLVATDNRGCKDSITTSVTVYALPPVTTTSIGHGGSHNICTGQFYPDIQAEHADWLGANTGSYSWTTGQTTSLITTTGAGTYTVTATDAHGCQATSSQTYTESTPPAPPTISPAGPLYICSGDGGATFTSNTLCVTNYSNSLEWNSGELTPCIVVDYPFTHNVTYTDNVGCTGTSADVTTIDRYESVEASSVTSNAIGNITCAVPVMLTANGGFLGDLATWEWYDEAGCGVNHIGSGPSITITPPAVPGPHTYYVRAEGYCNTTTCTAIIITVKEPSQDPTSASTTVPLLCAGDATTLSVNGGFLGTGASWKWYANGCGAAGGGTLVGIGQTISVNTGATTTYYVRAEGDCNNSACQTVTVTVRTLSTDPVSVSSNAAGNQICSGGGVTLTVNGGSLGTGAVWTWYEDACGNGPALGTGPSITVTPSSTGVHNYYVRAEGACNTTNCAGISISVAIPSVAATSATTNVLANSICAGNTVTLTANGGTLGSGAVWKWYANGCGTGASVGTGASITLTPAATTTYYVRAEGICNTTPCASVQVIRSTTPPVGNTKINTRPIGICAGNSDTVSVDPVANATFYTFSGPAGTLFNGQPSPYTTTSTWVIVYFGALPPGANGYDICAFAGNGCGTNGTKCKHVNGHIHPPQTISGPSNPCPNTSATYTIATQPGADTFTWSITGAANINGVGTTVTTNGNVLSVTVNFLPGWTNGVLSVYGSMSCGYNTPVRSISIVSTPTVPGPILGSPIVCPLQSSSFSIAPVSGATGYIWACNVPGSTVTPSGASCSVLFPANIPGGSQVSVIAVGTCGNSAPQTRSITNGVPAMPGTISGPAVGQCAQSSVSYSILPVSGATSYLWTASAGGSISGPNNLSAVSINFGTFSTCTLTVKAVNSCGSSAARTITVVGAPGMPALISGNQLICASNPFATYSTTGAVGATSYNWTVPSDASILGAANGASINVIWGTTNGSVTATGANDCGVGPTTSLSVNYNANCRQVQVAGSFGINASLYPNPTQGKTTLKFETATAGTYQLSVVDVTGRVLQSESMNAVEGVNLHEVNMTSYAKGVYMIRMERAGEPMQLLKVTIE